MADKQKYKAESIKVVEELEGVRRRFDVFELSNKVKKQGDVLVLSKELKVRPRILKSAVYEGRILSMLPSLQKSKAGVLASLRTGREVDIFSKKYNLNEIPARKLIKMIREWNRSIQTKPKLLVSDEEHEVIIGSLMGDASIRQREKNSCFRVAHSFKQERYINWKLDIFRFFNISEFVKRERIIKERPVKMIYLSTKTHAVFNYYRNLFYKGNKKVITKEILNQLTPRSLAIWVCDDGSYSVKQDYIVLCTNSYSLEEHKLIKKFFEDRFSLSPTIGFRDGKYYYLRFKKEDSKKLINIIKDFIPKGMEYKIGGLNGR